MKRLIEHTQAQNITIIYGLEVLSYDDLNTQVSVQCTNFEFKTNQLFLATNGFASQLLQEDVLPARAQVLITKPIKDLHIKGVFHMDEGYYYFRNVGNRILFGGARNLDIEGETTTDFNTTSPIMDRLEDLLQNTIAPNYPLEIDMRWSGIMGVGKQKAPIVKELSSRVFCGIRLGGMGVAIGSAVGQDLAALLD
jgi:glycine/D-amino acid oxidase-like deaminating enzyme